MMSRERLRLDTPARYQIRVEGHLDDGWRSWFAGLDLVREPDGTTALQGVVADQAALHGYLVKLRDIGATLVSVRSADAAEPTPNGSREVAPPPSGRPPATS